jgi:hypothetical protein
VTIHTQYQYIVVVLFVLEITRQFKLSNNPQHVRSQTLQFMLVVWKDELLDLWYAQIHVDAVDYSGLPLSINK